jgi:hypothetical protein
MAKKATETETKVDSQKAKREKRKKALAAVLNFLNGLESLPEDIKKAAAELIPGRTRAPQRAANAVFIDLFGALEIGASVKEDELWSKHKVGRAEMRTVMRDLIKKAEAPDKRLWVSFDIDKEIYTLEGKGVDAPDGWSGFVPMEVQNVQV